MSTATFTIPPRFPAHRPLNRYPQRFVQDDAFFSTAPAYEAAQRIETDPEAADQTGGTVFRLEAPLAQSVKLAGDFTGWEPLELSPGHEGFWQIIIPLSPGRYAYRFLVDGEWHDDPDCMEAEANPFGTINAVIDVN